MAGHAAVERAGKDGVPTEYDFAFEKIQTMNQPRSAASSHTSDSAILPKTAHGKPNGLKALVQDIESQPPDISNEIQHSVFTTAQKRYIVFMVAFAGFFSPLSSNIYFPALNTLASDFNVTPARINLTITTYMIFQGLAPTFFGDLADIAGRRPTYLIGFAIYIAACIGIASSENYASLLVLRCIQSSGSSGTIALASGVVADISTSSERGVYMGFAMSGPMVAPAVAPILGGIFAQLLGWRWIFWFLVICAASYSVLFAVTFPETSRNIVGNGSILPQGWNMSVLNYLQARRVSQSAQLSGTSLSIPQDSFKRRKPRIPNPLNSLYLLFEKDVALLLFYNSIVCCANYDIMASLPHLLEQIYGYNALQIGLCFIPFGVGCFLAPYLSGRLMDWNFRRIAKSIGFEIRKGRAEDLRNFPVERTRLAVVLPMVFLGAAAIACYGWVLYFETSLAAPMVLIFIIGLTMTGAFNVMTAMLVDLHPHAPATAQAANNLVRCLMGSGATAAIAYMISAMGRGWCFTFIAGVVVTLTPILWVLERFGPRWREARRLRVEKATHEKAKMDTSHVGNIDVAETKDRTEAIKVNGRS